jgi:hypothetical protein
MRRQFLCGAIGFLASLALVACEPYYGYGPGYDGYAPYGYTPYSYGPYGAYPQTPAAPPPAPYTVLQNSGLAATNSATCHKGLLWPFVREPGDCPTDAERFSSDSPFP